MGKPHANNLNTSQLLLFLLFLLLFITQAHSQDFDHGLAPYYYEESSDCYGNDDQPQQCQPSFVNVAYNRVFEATNTCGDGEDFCIQTGNTGSFCDVCREESIHARYLTDPRNNTWWQSSTMLQGLQYPASVNLTLDLGKSYHITYIRLKFHSLRPESFAIYKRNDPNEAWKAFQYYSSSCYETYGVRPNETLRRGREDVALCDNRATDTLPTSGGTVAFSTLLGRPSAREFKTSSVLQEWVTAREIRIILNRMNTFGDEVFQDPNVLKSYFYAISDIAIGGRCNCNGHASSCDGGACACEHHTTGADCEQCLPLFNARPWAKGTWESANECIACKCNGFSSKCYFDQALYQRTGDGGHCIECSDNRFGAHCELCAEGYFSYSSEDNCKPCHCNHMGSRNQQCDSRGVCACKEGVTGEKCDRCLPNYFGLSHNGCRACECSVAGSERNRPECVEGRCRCKENVQGDHCDTCKKGYYGLNAEDPFGCILCHCNGHSNTCHTSPAYHLSAISSHFNHEDAERWKGVGEDGKSVPVVVQDRSIQVPSATNAFFVAPVEYTGNKRLSYNLELSFTLRDPHQNPPSQHDVIIESTNGKTVYTSFSTQNNPTPSAASQSYRFILNEHSFYGWSPPLRHEDFMTLLADVVSIKIKASGQLSDFKLQTAVQGHGRQAAYNVERCECPQGYVGQYCESCAPGYRRHGNSASDACIACDCNGHSDTCDPSSGRCICSHNTVGENCERCAPGYYGNALSGRPDACKPCPCPNRGQCEMAGGEVVCRDCMPGYAGNRCEECADGYYGDPQGMRGGRRRCEVCDCHGNIDPNEPGNCDKWTGECLKCIYNTAGFHCERCLPNHHGNPKALPRGQCKPCMCDRDGAMEDERGDRCNTYTGQCLCKPNVIGAACDRCADGFWSIRSNRGCERCDCGGEGSLDGSCDVRSGECRCKKGVGGGRCDRCLPHHYGFSARGCSACDCNPEGSNTGHCDPLSGQCQCRQGVEGRRCDRCAKHSYLGPGGACVECPECYRLVQRLADGLQGKLTEMKVFVNYLLHDTNHHHDHHFTTALHHVNSTLVHMWRQIKHSRGGATGGAPSDEIIRAQRVLHDLLRTTNTIFVTITTSTMRCDTANTDLLRALSLINNIEQMLTSNEQKLQRQGLVALRKVHEAQREHGTHSQTLTRVAHQARRLVENLEMTSGRIEQTTNEALRMSEEALRLAHQFQATPGSVGLDVERIRIKLTQLHQEHQRTKTQAEASSHEAQRSYDTALQLLSTINSLPTPQLTPHDEGYEEELRRTRIEAERLEREVADLAGQNTKIIKDMKYHLRIARDTYKRAIREQQVLEEMLAEVDSARARSVGAVQGANDAYHQAQQDLRTLQQFDEKVKKSKRLSQEALYKRDVILRGIKQAEEMTNKATSKLANADQNALSSKRAIDEAAATVEKALALLDDMAKRSDVTEEELLQLNKQSFKFKVQLDKVVAMMNEAAETIAADETKIQLAKENSDIARSRATNVLDTLTKHRRNFNKLIKDLLNLEEYDPLRVETLERKVKQLERSYEGQSMYTHMREMQDMNDMLNVLMDEYEGQMKQLRLDVLNIGAINATIPRVCFKSVVLEPIDHRPYF